ncbi:MAG: diguanylate cyclase [bacterium]
MTGDILIVDDDHATIQLIGRILNGVGRLRFAMSGVHALKLMREAVPDLVLLDAEMPEMSGFSICDAMKADAALRDVAVIFVTSHDSAEFELAGFQHGAVDFIAKPVREPVLLARVKTQLRVKQLTDQLRLLSTTDTLTGIANRRRFDEAMTNEWSRCLRGDELTIALFDVDYFKPYNDQCGHQAGDACLQMVARALSGACARTADLVTRIGGDEFAVILPQTAREGARAVIRRMLDAVADVRLPALDSATMSPMSTVSVSVGVASCDAASACWSAGKVPRYNPPMHANTSTELLRAADRALYVAKQNGRARAYFLDVADVEFPERAFALAVPHESTARPHLARESATDISRVA